MKISGFELGLIALMTSLALSAGFVLIRPAPNRSAAKKEGNDMSAHQAAEAAVDHAADLIRQAYVRDNAPLTLPSGTRSSHRCLVSYATSDDGDTGARGRSFTISSTAVGGVDRGRVSISRRLETAAVPLLSYAVFYNHDMWTTPTQKMAVWGPVHVNGDIYVQSSRRISFDGPVTVAGRLRHGFPPWSGVGEAGGEVRFRVSDGSWVGMRENGDWFDSDHPLWRPEAGLRWDGLVRDGELGQLAVALVLSTEAGGDAHRMIERNSGNTDSYERRADLKIIDGVMWARVDGVWQDVSDSLSENALGVARFYDDRDDRWVRATDLSLEELRKDPFFGLRKAIYASDRREGFNALRLRDGRRIGRALTVSSENPVYVLGDFNVDYRQPAAIMADAVTILSNDWRDEVSDQPLREQRVVTQPTIVNATIVAGDIPPTAACYGGGLENLPRLLEHWDRQKLTIGGSLICLWRSRQATGEWKYGGWEEYYTAPDFRYRFDADAQGPEELPPSCPQVRVFTIESQPRQFVENDDRAATTE